VVLGSTNFFDFVLPLSCLYQSRLIFLL